MQTLTTMTAETRLEHLYLQRLLQGIRGKRAVSLWVRSRESNNWHLQSFSVSVRPLSSAFCSSNAGNSLWGGILLAHFYSWGNWSRVGKWIAQLPIHNWPWICALNLYVILKEKPNCRRGDTFKIRIQRKEAARLRETQAPWESLGTSGRSGRGSLVTGFPLTYEVEACTVLMETLKQGDST